jgi:arylsulfatase A-like enzyme
MVYRSSFIPVHGTDTMYWRATPCSVIRKGDWKLIEYFEDQSVELFNIKRDIGEAHDLSDSYPVRTTDLLDELHAWQQATGAEIPATPNPDYRIASAGGSQRGTTQ